MVTQELVVDKYGETENLHKHRAGSQVELARLELASEEFEDK